MDAALIQHNPPGSLNSVSRASPHAMKGQPWQHDAQLWLRGGRMARELHQDAVESCKVGRQCQVSCCMDAICIVTFFYPKDSGPCSVHWNCGLKRVMWRSFLCDCSLQRAKLRVRLTFGSRIFVCCINQPSHCGCRCSAHRTHAAATRSPLGW
jgi:hypothetical protein